MRTHEGFDELTDAPPTYHGVQSTVNLFVQRNGQLLLHGASNTSIARIVAERGGNGKRKALRRVFHGFFSRLWAMPQFDNLRSMPLELLERCTPFQRQLLGYDRQAPWEERWGDWRRTEIPGVPSKQLWEQ